MEFCIEKCAMLAMKSGKWHKTEGVELPNQVIRTLGKKETYKYLGTPSNKGNERKNKKNISEDPENYSRQNSLVGTESKG